jgi:two-component system cell cycle sensor histidine kinase/response regulator CckA
VEREALALAARLRLEVDSAPGPGTAFTIRLPAARADHDAQQEPPDAPAVAAPRATVLVAEDDESLRALARRVLEGDGYTVLAAGSGEHALELAEAHPGPIDALISDVVMPGMRGPQLAAKLTAARPELRVLLVSGYTEEPLDERPGAAFLAKPFSPTPCWTPSPG